MRKGISVLGYIITVSAFLFTTWFLVLSAADSFDGGAVGAKNVSNELDSDENLSALEKFTDCKTCRVVRSVLGGTESDLKFMSFVILPLITLVSLVVGYMLLRSGTN